MSEGNDDAVATWLFRLAAVLWVIWGGVHLFAGIMTMSLIGSGDTGEAVFNIVPKAGEAVRDAASHGGVSAILSQHGWNLAWAGLLTLLCAPFVWRGRPNGVYLAALVGGLFDIGYFIFIDLGGYAEPPGPQMTYICATAIATSLYALSRRRSG